MFVIDIPYFNLDQIYNSGQVPRWIQLRQSPEKSSYVVIHKDKALKIEQIRNKYDWNNHRILMNCSEEEFFNIWFHYFDLKTDYVKENAHIKKMNGKFKKIANRGAGIHIIKQDPFETYIYTKIVEVYGYSKARKAINHIAEVCGVQHTQSMREAGRITWYEFPTAEMILENFDKLKKMGQTNEWLKALCKGMIANNNELVFISTDKLFKLFALHDNVFPLNEIEQTLIKNFGENPEEF